MIVTAGSPSKRGLGRGTGQDNKGKALSRDQKAKEFLKKAIKNGKIEETLWGKNPDAGLRSNKGNSDSPQRAYLLPKSPAEQRRLAMIEDFRKYLQDAKLMDDIAIWNKVLMSRVLHGDIDGGVQDDDELAALLATLGFVASENKSNQPNRADQSHDDNSVGSEKGDEISELQNEARNRRKKKNRRRNRIKKSNDTESSTAEEVQDQDENRPETPSKGNKGKQCKGKDINSISQDSVGDNKQSSIKKEESVVKSPKKDGKKKSKKSNQEPTPAVPAPEPPPPPSSATSSVLRNFEALPVLDKNQSYYMGAIRKPKRVSQIIKESKNFQIVVKDKESNSSSGSETTSTDTDSTRSDDEVSRLSGYDDDSTVASEIYDRFDMGGDGARWGGTTTTAAIHNNARARNSVIRKSIDVVAGLFQMSNELREERENIMTRTTKDGGNNNIEAFINRETTLKYNDELDEVAQSKQESMLTQRRAALLRIRKNASRYRTYKSTSADRFSTLWEQMKPYRKIIIDHDTRLGESDSHEDSEGEGTIEDDSTTKRSNVNKNSTTIASNQEHDSSVSSSHISIATPSAEGGPPANILESIFEQDLNLLFATKVKATSYSGKKTTTNNVANSGTNSSPLRRFPAGGMKLFNPAEYGLEENSEIEDPESPKFEYHRSRSLSTIGSIADMRSNSIRLANQKNLNAIIEKMKAMGVYSDSKFNRRSSSTGTSSDSLSKRREGMDLIVEGFGSFSRSKDPNDEDPRQPGINVSRWIHSSKDDDLKAKEKYLEVLKGKINNIGDKLRSDSFDEDQDGFDDKQELGQGSLMELSTASIAGKSTATSVISKEGSTIDDSIFSHGADGLSAVPPPLHPIFLTQHLAGLNVNFEASTHLSVDMMHRIGNKSPNLLPPEPMNAMPLIKPNVSRPGTRERQADPLQGRWNYDTLLGHDALKHDQQPHFYRRRENKKMKRERQVLHLATRRDIYKEIVFNAETCQLCLLTKEGEDILHCIAVDLETVYITDTVRNNKLDVSSTVDMVIVKTTDVDQVKNGYLGAFPMQQWIKIEEEMNQSLVKLMTAKKDRVKRKRERKQSPNNPIVFSPNGIAEKTKEPREGGVQNTGLAETSLISALTHEDSSSIQQLPPQPTQPMTFLDHTSMLEEDKSVMIPNDDELADREEMSEKYITIPRYHGKRDDLPFVNPTVHSEKYMQMKRQIMMTYQPDKLHITRQRQLEMLLEKAMKTIRIQKPRDKKKRQKKSKSTRQSPSPDQRMNRKSRSPSPEVVVKSKDLDPGGESTLILTSTISAITEETPEPHRFHDLLPTVTTKHWTKQKRPKLAGQEEEYGGDEEEPFHSMIAEKGTLEIAGDVNMGHSLTSQYAEESTIANSLTIGQLQELKQSKFNLAQQVIPLTPTPPIFQPAMKNHGYDASGFVACNQSVAFTIKGFTPNGSMFSPMKPSRPGATQKSFRTSRLTANLSESSLLTSLGKGEDSDKNIGQPGGQQAAETLQAAHLVSSADAQRLSPVLAMEAEPEGAAADVNTQPLVIPSSLLSAVEEVKKARDPSRNQDDLSAHAVAPPAPEKMKFSYEFQIILLVESRRIMQLYFAKKFLQLDLAVNVHLTPYDATESLLDAPDIYGLIFISYIDLQTFGIEKTLKSIIPLDIDKSKYSIIVYDIGHEDDEELSLLESYGVADVLYPPYTIAALKATLDAHQRKQEIRMEYVHED